jgi:hypothetical protein
MAKYSGSARWRSSGRAKLLFGTGEKNRMKRIYHFACRPPALAIATAPAADKDPRLRRQRRPGLLEDRRSRGQKAQGELPNYDLQFKYQTGAA